MSVWNPEVQTQLSAVSENYFSSCTIHVCSSVAGEFCEGVSSSMVYALTLICRLQTNTLCKCLSQTQNSSRSWSPFCIQTQGDWFWFYTHILARAGAHLRWFLRPDPCPLFNLKSPVPCTLPTPWLSVLEVSWPPAHPASPLVLQRVDEADERLQRTSRAGLTVMWLITKQLWNTSSGAGPEKNQLMALVFLTQDGKIIPDFTCIALQH